MNIGLYLATEAVHALRDEHGIGQQANGFAKSRACCEAVTGRYRINYELNAATNTAHGDLAKKYPILLTRQ